MKTTITKAIVALAILTSGAMAQAADIPAWICNLNFQGKSKSVQVFVGKSEFNGAGTIRCLAASGETAEYPITVTMETKPLAPFVGLGKMKLYGEALQIALSTGTPEALLGNYYVAEARAAVGVGAGAIVAVRAGNENLSLTVALQLIKGFGAEVGFRKMKIELDHSRLN